jgi:hypothetical protein
VNVKRVVTVASQLQHAKQHAVKDQSQQNCTSAAGTQLFHNASKVQRVHKPRLNVFKEDATQPLTENAISRTTHAYHAIILKTQNASRPWTTAKLLKVKEDARLKSYLVYSE